MLYHTTSLRLCSHYTGWYLLRRNENHRVSVHTQERWFRRDFCDALPYGIGFAPYFLCSVNSYIQTVAIKESKLERGLKPTETEVNIHDEDWNSVQQTLPRHHDVRWLIIIIIIIIIITTIIIIIFNIYIAQINIQEDMIKCALHIKIESKITMLPIYNFEFTIKCEDVYYMKH